MRHTRVKVWPALALGMALIAPSTAIAPALAGNGGMPGMGVVIQEARPDEQAADATARRIALVLSSLGMLGLVALHRLAGMHSDRPSL